MSSTPQTHQNNPTPDYDLADLLDVWKRDIFLTMNCHHLGSIVSFSPATQQAQVTIDYSKTYYKLNTATGSYSPYQVTYPVLIDCPVIFVGGGGCADTAPVSKGDEVLVIFNDRNIDTWLQGTKGAALASNGLHAFSDAIILVGIRSLPNVLKNFDPVRAVKRGGTAVLGVNPTNNKVLVTNSAPTVAGDGSLSYSTTLNTLLQNLCTQLNNLTAQLASLTVIGVSSGGSASGVPANAAAITAIGTQISSIATQIGGLLE